MSFNPRGFGMIHLKLLVIIAALLVFGSGMYLYHYLHETGAFSPGPLSATQRHGTPLGGYAYHAEFEQKCTHCHAPIHCLTEERCQECHQEVARQGMQGDGVHGRLPSGRCQTCHTEHKGREAIITRFAFANIDHDKLADFSLAQHATNFDGTPLTCESCHSQDRFAAETLDCLTCHAQDNHDFVADHIEQYGTGCVECHDGRDRMANFDHNQLFPLTDGHALAMCDDCHPDHTYAGTPRDCAACHPEPEMHAEQFGLDCIRCHTAAAWTPAQLTQHIFPLNHGNLPDLQCEDCHPTTYTTYTCYSCHDHTPADMEAAHIAAGFTADEISACAVCHPTGQRNEMPTQPSPDGQNVALN